MSTHQRIEEQYPMGKYLSVNRTGVTFTQPSATLRYDLEPVSGWFITAQGDTTRKVYFKPSNSHIIYCIYIHCRSQKET